MKKIDIRMIEELWNRVFKTSIYEVDSIVEIDSQKSNINLDKYFVDQLRKLIDHKKAQPEPYCANCEHGVRKEIFKKKKLWGQRYCLWDGTIHPVKYYCKYWRKEG